LEKDDSHFRAAIARRARNDFEFFFNTIFTISAEQIEGQFVRGDWLNRLCRRLQNGTKTCTGAARKHGKTTVLLAFVMWLLFRCGGMPGKVVEYLYIMYSDELACEKIKRTKQYVEVNPFFNGIRDLKPTADTFMEYLVGDHIFTLKPAGIFSFKRGRHPDGVICDDILRDPTKRLDVSQIEKITQTFEAEVTALPREGGFLHLVGTAQDKTDIFFVLKTRPAWDWEWNTAYPNGRKAPPLWPEMFTAARLRDIEINETGKKNFLKEYMLIPQRMADSYMEEHDYEMALDKQLINYGIIKSPKDDHEFGESVAGFDIGKKRHPAHIAVFEIVESKKVEYLVQVHSYWFDGIDYTDQVKHCERAGKRFGIIGHNYDATRGEFDGFAERGELPDEMEGVTLTAKEEGQLAVDMEKMFNQGRIILLNDERQKRQFLSVDNSLKAPESADGHGEPFWSISLAVKAYVERSPLLTT